MSGSRIFHFFDKDYSTDELCKELAKREADEAMTNYYKIKNLAAKNKVKLAAQLIVSGYDENYPYIMLGVLKKGKFKDFYYSSNLEYEEFQKYIPEGFSEAMESTYEYHGETSSKDDYLKKAFDILEKCGYKRVEDFID